MDIPGYRMLGTIGHGAQSTIYRVADALSGREYALKRVVRRGPRDHRFIEQAENEHAVAGCLDHPHLRRTLSLRRIRRFFILREVHVLMEWVPGRTLEKECPTDISTLTDVFLAIARGLHAMHAAYFLHCDTKPNNIILTARGAARVKLIDFGQSCRMGHRKARIQGTPEYIAPEQVGRLPLDARTDVFNLGATMYWTLTKQNVPTVLPSRNGRPGNLTDYERRVLLVPEEVDYRVPTALSNLVLECCQPDRDHRPANMEQVISRLAMVRHILDGTISSPRSAI